jgi:heptosyltransferase-2
MEIQGTSRFLPPDYTEENFIFKADCRYFKGDVPCKFWRPCFNCNLYDPIGSRVLIILLRRLGDILIASPLAQRIKKEMPNAHLTWLVNNDCAPLVRMNPFVDQVLVFDWQAATQLRAETYDLVLGFERTPSAAALMEQINARKKAGLAFGSPNNTLYPIGQAAQHFFKMNTWNDYRTSINTKTWTELYFEVAEFKYEEEPYSLELSEEIKQQAQEYFKSINTNTNPLICLNIGGSLKTKIWPESSWLHLAQLLIKCGYRILLMGGPSEANAYENLVTQLNVYSQKQVYVPGTNCSLEFFCACIEKSNLVITGDSLGFHVAIAFDKPTVVLFGPSSPNEVVPKHKHNIRLLRSKWICSPCARQIICNGVGGCMEAIEVEEVSTLVELLLTSSYFNKC